MTKLVRIKIQIMQRDIELASQQSYALHMFLIEISF